MTKSITMKLSKLEKVIGMYVHLTGFVKRGLIHVSI